MRLNKKESFFNGIIYLMISQIIIKILGMIYSLYLTNQKGFGDEGNAICMAGFQVYALALGICAIGVPNSVSKMVSERMEIGDWSCCKKILKIALVTFSSMGFFLCILLYKFSDFIAIHILSISSSSSILKILAPSIVFSCMESVYRGFFNGIKKISISAKSACFEQIFKTILTLFCVQKIGELTNFNTELMAKASMISASVATIFSFVYSYIKYKKLELVGKQSCCQVKLNNIVILKQLLTISIPISLTTVLMILGSNIDSITIVRLLKSKLGESEARSIYGIIISKVNLLTSLPLALNGAVSISLIPEISRNVIKQNHKRLKRNIFFSIGITLLISIPVMIVLFFFSEKVMKLLYPNAPRGSELLKISSVSIVFSCLTQNFSGFLQGIGDSKSHLKAVLIGMIIKFVLNFVLISNENILEKGAVISTIASNFLIFLIMFEKSTKALKQLKNKAILKN